VLRHGGPKAAKATPDDMGNAITAWPWATLLRIDGVGEPFGWYLSYHKTNLSVGKKKKIPKNRVQPQK
jgi:hypothetical protein